MNDVNTFFLIWKIGTYPLSPESRDDTDEKLTKIKKSF